MDKGIETMAETKRVKMVTFGCQMNVADSEKMLGMLGELGYQPTEVAAEADMVLFNTCTIRENAVEKLKGHLGALKALKQDNPDLVIGIAGCAAQAEGESIRKIYPHVDLVFGTHNIYRLPELLALHETRKQPVVEITRELEAVPEDVPTLRQGNGLQAWVTVSVGCDKRCTYCIVPYVRGNEISRRPAAILAEVQRLGQEGFKEITLLGQNIDSYGDDLDPQSSLAELLHLIHPVEGIDRIRFLTSHPADLTSALIDAVATLPKVCEYLNLPLQAGNDRILRFMARGYTVEKYASLVDEIRRKIPNVGLTTDLIVGFPGETEAEFLDTVEAVKRFRFDMVNSAAYSIRKGTPAGRMADQVPEAEKTARLAYLNQVVQETMREINAGLVASVQEVLVEKPNPKTPGQMTGRTRSNKIVHLVGEARLGETVMATITGASAWSLQGDIVRVGVPVPV
jgi:tRNA-2-methylthio-N6-dimethylallyladenosine synthase